MGETPPEVVGRNLVVPSYFASKRALDRHMIGCPEQAHVTSILTVAHGPLVAPHSIF